MSRRFTGLMAIVVVVALLVPTTWGAPGRGGTLAIGSNDTIKSLAWYHSGSSSDYIPIIHMAEGLAAFEQGSFKVVPRLAERWQASADGLRWTVQIRKGVKFHDGTELTAEDVKYTYEVMKDPATKARQSRDFATFKETIVKDKYTVEVVMEKPFAPFVAKILVTPIYPKHYHSSMKLEEFNTKPMGTGPFKFKEWFPTDRMVMERFDGYWGGPAYLDAVVMKMMSEASVRMLALRTGEIQLDKWFPPPAELPKFKADRNFNAYQFECPCTRIINLNNKHPFFGDRKVRQALMFAIDRDALIKNLFPGQAVAALHQVSPVYPDWRNTNVKKYTYNPAEARKLLAEAGWKPGPGGILVNAQDQPFKFTLLHIQGEEETLNTAVAAQKWLKDVGIQMEIENQETATVIDRVWNKKEFDAAIYVWTLGGRQGDPDVAPQWHSKGNDNQPLYANPKVDELIDKGLATMNYRERVNYYKEVSAILAEDVPMLWLMHPIFHFIASARLKGLKNGPNGQYDYLHKAWLER